MSNNKRQLLDPLGTICKLVSLIFSELNTKISIQNHVLTLQKPYYSQCLIRLYNGDGKENVSELYFVIIRIIKWYLITDYKYSSDESAYPHDPSDPTDYIQISSPGTSPGSFIFSSSPVVRTNSQQISDSLELKKIIKYLCEALRQLQRTYEDGNVVFTLQYFIILLEDGLNGVFDKNKLPKHILEKEDRYETLLDYNKLKNLWELKKLRRICELYDNCFQLNENNTCNSNEKQALISGYLSSITSILEVTDNEFQRLIRNSNSG